MPVERPIGPQAGTSRQQRRRGLRIRAGVLMVLLSWMPFATLAVWLTSASGSEASQMRAVIWSVQILVGAVGVLLAGRETVRIAKSVGWKKAPGVVWRVLRSPNTPIST